MMRFDITAPIRTAGQAGAGGMAAPGDPTILNIDGDFTIDPGGELLLDADGPASFTVSTSPRTYTSTADGPGFLSGIPLVRRARRRKNVLR